MITRHHQIYTVLVHEAKEGGYWAEVAELPGCCSQGETLEELKANIKEGIQAVETWTTGTGYNGVTHGGKAL